MFDYFNLLKKQYYENVLGLFNICRKYIIKYIILKVNLVMRKIVNNEY